MLRTMVCAQCGKESEPTDCWLPGWCCVVGIVSACSRKCARKWIIANARYEYAVEPDAHIEEHVANA